MLLPQSQASKGPTNNRDQQHQHSASGCWGTVLGKAVSGSCGAASGREVQLQLCAKVHFTRLSFT